MSIEILSPPPGYDSIDGLHSDPKAVHNPAVKAQQELIDYLKTTARGTIVDDILKLSGTIISIENDFATVASEMTKLDDRNIVSVKFAPKWKILHDNYTKLIVNSQSTANDISDKINDLVTVHIPVLQQRDETLETKKELLIDYIEELKAFKIEAQDNATSFLRLAQEVAAFKNLLKNTVESESEAVKKKFEDIDTKIAELEKALGKTSNLLQRGWNAVKTTITGKTIKEIPMTETDIDHLDIAGIDSLGDIAPTVRDEMMEIVLRYLNSDLADDLKKKPKEMDTASIQKQLALFRFMRAQSRLIHDDFTVALQDLLKLEPVFEGMTKKISAIQGIWLMLLKDSQTLLNKLVSLTDAKREVIFNQHVKTMHVMYETLQFSLGEYALAVTKPT